MYLTRPATRRPVRPTTARITTPLYAESIDVIPETVMDVAALVLGDLDRGDLDAITAYAGTELALHALAAVDADDPPIMLARYVDTAGFEQTTHQYGYPVHLLNDLGRTLICAALDGDVADRGR